MDALMKPNETSSFCPTVIVVGGFSVGKSAVINAVVHGCTKVLDTSACSATSGITSCINEATSFIEIDSSTNGAQGERLADLQNRIARADAVWFVFRAGDAIAESDVEFYERCCKYACERLFVLTHVDVINEAAQRQTKERVQTIFHDFGVEIDDRHVCFVNALRDSQELTARYLELRERKKRCGLQCQQSEQYALESYGAISGCELVERVLDRFDDDGVAKLLECTRSQESEFLEFKTSYLLSEEEKKKGISLDALTWDIVQAIFAIANTSGGALIIGICDDGKCLHPVNVVGDDEKFLRCQIVQKILPDQRCWRDGKGGHWSSSELPKVEPRLCHYSDGVQAGRVVVLLIEPQPRGRILIFEDSVNRNGSLLCYREKGYGKTRTSKDSRNFSTIDNERRIQRHHYLTLLRKFIPDAGQPAIGQSSGAYRLKPVAGRDVDSCDDEVIVSTDGHRLRYQFNPSDRIGKYCVIEKLGQGGMGVVYRVKDTRFCREYALKAFMSTAEECQMQKERFMTEAKLLSKLDHEGLPKVYDCDYDRQSECLYLVEDLIVGEDNRPHELAKFTCVQSVARSEGFELVSEDQSLKWLRQVCEIASYLHDNGVEHRDITLKNLLVTKDGNLKLTDFGIAKVVDEKLREEVGANVTMTFTQTPNASASFMGTLHYLPPEVKNKKKNLITPETTDMWAIGVCFFKLLTGEWFEYQQFEDFDWNKGLWGELLRGMLKVDSRKRMKCSEVIRVVRGAATGHGSKYSKLNPVWDKVVLVDCDNIMWSGVEIGGKVLYHIVSALKKDHDVRIYASPDVVDRTLSDGGYSSVRYLMALKRDKRCLFVETPGADVEMLELCQAHGCQIVTNNKFSVFASRYPFVDEEKMYGCSPMRRYTAGKSAYAVSGLCGGPLPEFDDVMPSGELPRHLEDHDLDFLLSCTSEELEPLVAAILGTVEKKDLTGNVVKNERGNIVKEIDRSGRYSSELDKTTAFKKCYPDHEKYVFDIIADLQLFGGDAFANKIRGHGVTYREMLADVVKRLKLQRDSGGSLDELEHLLLEYVFNGMWSKMSAEQRKQLLSGAGDFCVKDVDRASVAELVRTGSLPALNVVAIVASAMSEQLLGRGIAIAAQFGAGGVAALWAGPVGWALTAVGLLVSCASTAYRVTIPACVYIAALRQLKCSPVRH